MTKRKPNTAFSIDYRVWLGLILLLTIMAYSNAVNNEILIFDDNQYFQDFPEITNLSWESVKSYFTKHYVLMYHPLPILSFAINYKLSGLNPVPMHAVNIFFHLINVVLALFFLKRFIKNQTICLLLVALWAVHPMNTEAVTWISARSSVMYACFFLAGLLSYLKFQEKREYKFYWFTLLFCLLSMFSKANAVAFPVVLVLLELYYSKRFDLKKQALSLPFFAIAVAFGLMALSNQGTQDNIKLIGSDFGVAQFPLLAGYSIWFYLKSFLVPIGLSAIHTYPNMVAGFPIEFYVGTAIVLLLVVLIIWKVRNKTVLFGFLFFGAIISLTLQILPSRLFLVADRYVYLPYLGLLIAIGVLLTELSDKKGRNFFQNTIGVAVFISLLFAFVCFNRNKTWQDTLTLMNDIIEKNPEVPYLSRAYGIKASILQQTANGYQAALENFNKAIAIREDDAISYYNRANLRYKLRDYQGARKDFQTFIQLGEVSMHWRAYHEIGLCYFGLDQKRKALANYDKSIQLNPNFADAYNNRGVVYALQEDYPRAINDFGKAITLNPKFVDAFKNRGFAYIKLNDRQQACADLLTVKSLGSNVANDLIQANNCE